jgi:1-acyl-sn-glycerol-3-phosphate acyltransferase
MPLAIVLQKSALMQKISRQILHLVGWRSNVTLPGVSSYVLVGAPHTSNWDFAIMMLLTTSAGIPVNWMGKDSLFKGPLGFLMRFFGAISVNRKEQTNLVDQIASMFDNKKELIVVISPEGTRSKTSRWRTGFYYIALKANVPIVMAYADYKNKVCGIGPIVIPTGDIQADFEIIRDFYKGIEGKHPLKQSAITL